MLGFVRKREVEELRAEIWRLKCKASGVEANNVLVDCILDGLRRQLGFSETKFPVLKGRQFIEYHVHYSYPNISVNEKIKMILSHLKLKAVPEEVNTTTATTPAHLVPITAKANKRTAKKANGGDEDGE